MANFLTGKDEGEENVYEKKSMPMSKRKFSLGIQPEKY